MKKLNKISVRCKYNPFSEENYYVIIVDGKPLDEIVSDPGLIPTLLNWLEDPVERKIVWDRVIPEIGTVTRLPILMCSEDIGLYCVVIIAEVMADENYVYWKRLGKDTTKFISSVSEIGNNVNWFHQIDEMCFDRKEYIDMVATFEKYLDSDFGIGAYPDNS